MYIDIETSAGVRVGDGPIITAEEFTATKRLDRAGSTGFPMPATDERSSLVLAKRVARAYALVGGTVTEVGSGIIDEISVKINNKGGADLDVAGDDLLRELTYHHVGKTEIGTEAVPATTGPAQIAALFPTGWSLDLVIGHNSTLKAIHHKFEGESCLAALVKLVELTGEHFRLGTGRKVIWMQDDRPASGVRAVQGGEPVALEGNPDVCVITRFEETQDTYDCYIGRVYGYGTGDGDSRVHFHDAVNNHIPDGYVISSDAMGWYFQHTATYAAHGIQRYMSFKDVSDATTLCEQAYEWMSRRLAAQKSYRLSVTKLDREVTVGSTIRVVYKRIIDGFVAINVDADMVILEATTKTDQSGARTVDFQVATTDAWPDSDTSATVDGLGQSENFYTHSQGFTTSVDTWAAIAEALGMIILRPANGDPCTFYDPDEAGVGDALGDAVSGDEIIGPYAVPIAMTAGITIPVSVVVRMLNCSFTCGGSAVILSNYSELHQCRIYQNGSGQATTFTIDAHGVDGAKIDNCILVASGATSNTAAYLSGVSEGHGPEITRSYATAVNGSNNAGISLGNNSYASYSYGGARGGSVVNRGVYVWANSSSQETCAEAIACSFAGGNTGGYGGYIDTGCYLISTNSRFWYTSTGTAGLYLAGTLYAFGNYWRSLTGSGTVVYLSGDRLAVVHHTQHESGGIDAIKLDDLAAPDNNTDLNATASAHGLLPMLSGDSGDVLLGDGTWGAGGGAEAFTDLTDVPGSYIGHDGDLVAVTPGEDGLEFESIDFVEDAPADGTIYGRKDNTWEAVGNVDAFTDLSDVPASYTSHAGDMVSVNGTENALEFQAIDFLEDAPSDGDTYGRQDGDWVIVDAGLTDAASDGNTYGRKDGAWVNLGGYIQIYPDHCHEWIDLFKKVSGSWTSMSVDTDFNRLLGASWYQNTPGNGDSAEIKVLLKAGTYNFVVNGTTQDNCGIIDWSIDGSNFITGQDWYSSSTAKNVSQTGSFTIASDGEHTIRMTINGKNGSSSNYYWQLTCIQAAKT